MFFQFCSLVWLWMLLTGSGYELCGSLSALFQAVAYHPPTVQASAFPAFVYWKFAWRSAPYSSPLLWCAYSTLPSLLCVSFQFLVYYSVFFYGAEEGSVCPGGYADLSQGWLGEYCVMLGAHLFGLPNVSQAVSELAYGSAGALLFSQCNVAWSSFVQAGGSGCLCFDSSWCFFSAKCSSSASARVLIYRAHTVCFCTLVAILDPPPNLWCIIYLIFSTILWRSCNLWFIVFSAPSAWPQEPDPCLTPEVWWPQCECKFGKKWYLEYVVFQSMSIYLDHLWFTSSVFVVFRIISFHHPSCAGMKPRASHLLPWSSFQNINPTYSFLRFNPKSISCFEGAIINDVSIHLLCALL
jgi:hypothetical protein